MLKLAFHLTDKSQKEYLWGSCGGTSKELGVRDESSVPGSALHSETSHLLADFSVPVVISSCGHQLQDDPQWALVQSAPSLDKVSSVRSAVSGRNDVRSPLSLNYENHSFYLQQHALRGRPAALSTGYSSDPAERPPWQETEFQTTGSRKLSAPANSHQRVFSEAAPGTPGKALQYNATPGD